MDFQLRISKFPEKRKPRTLGLVYRKSGNSSVIVAQFFTSLDFFRLFRACSLFSSPPSLLSASEITEISSEGKIERQGK